MHEKHGFVCVHMHFRSHKCSCTTHIVLFLTLTLLRICRSIQVVKYASNPFPLTAVSSSVMGTTTPYLATLLRAVLISGPFNLGEAFPKVLRYVLRVFIVIFFVWLFSFLFLGAPEGGGPPQSHHPLHQPVQP